uniref:Uncharacterized protein n=1 Tax=Solanum tuberosum TaxID=4113 RepID=M1E0I8_SOLTU
MTNTAAGQPSASAGPTLPLSPDYSFPILQALIRSNLINPKPNDPTGLPTISKESLPMLGQYVDILKANNGTGTNSSTKNPIPIKKLCYNKGLPRVVWTEEEVDRMIIIENLQYMVIGKFSCKWPEI